MEEFFNISFLVAFQMYLLVIISCIQSAEEASWKKKEESIAFLNMSEKKVDKNLNKPYIYITV